MYIVYRRYIHGDRDRLEKLEIGQAGHCVTVHPCYQIQLSNVENYICQQETQHNHYIYVSILYSILKSVKAIYWLETTLFHTVCPLGTPAGMSLSTVLTSLLVLLHNSGFCKDCIAENSFRLTQQKCRIMILFYDSSPLKMK